MSADISDKNKKKRKRITSLLFYSFMPPKNYNEFLANYEALPKTRYDHPVPALGFVEMNQHELKCVLDFSSEIDSNVEYSIFLSHFIESHERFFSDVIAINKDFSFTLSALVDVDRDLAVFGLKSPKIPDTISGTDRFEFDYFVWHVAP